MQIVSVRKSKGIKAKIIQFLNLCGLTNCIFFVVRNDKKIKITRREFKWNLKKH